MPSTFAVRWLERADIYAKTAGKRGPDLFSVQFLTLDLTGLEHVTGEGFEYGFLA
jgi:hypothetical protein